MTARGVFPRGWADFAFQLAIWVGFGLAYQVARGLAHGDPLTATANGRFILEVEQELGLLVERDLQRVVSESGYVLQVCNWTYWLSQFTVIGAALVWIYFFRHDSYGRVRNWLLTANTLGLVGYVVMPAAPPRMFPEEGFIDTLAASAPLDHGSGLIEIASNQYAAMPSLHAADALIVGFAMASLVRGRWARLGWTLWPSWVWFALMATGNHFWLDIAAGVGVAVVAGTIVAWIETRRPEVSPAVAPPRRW